MIGEMDDESLSKSLKRLSYVSSPAYISFLYHLLRGEFDPLFEDDFTMLNMFYYSLYQDTPDVVGFKDPMDFVTSLRGHKKGYNEFLEYLAVKKAEPKPVKEILDLGYDCVLDLYSRYSRNEILAAFDYWNWSKRPAMREGVLYIPDKKTDLFFITLKKTEDEYSSTTTYEDYFIDKEQFHWQSQSTTPETSPTGQRYINHVGMGNQVLLFVREQKVKQGKTVPYIFLGKVSYVNHEGSRPMNIIWKLEKPVPDEIYAELYVERGESSHESGIENPGKSIMKVQTTIPDYYMAEGFHLPFSIENSESSDLVEEAREVIEFEVTIIKDKDTLSVSAQNAVCIIKKNFLGYTIETQSTLLSQELGLSDKVLATRESLKNIQQLAPSPFDSTILRLTNNCTFPSLSLALEMILGCRWEDCPTFDVLPAESVWKFSFDKSSLQSSVVEELPEEAKVVEVGRGETEEEEEEEVDMHSSDASTECPDKLGNVVRVEVKIVKKNDHTLHIYAGNAVATINKSVFGYTIGAQCTILNQDLGLSENVASIRKSLKSTESLLPCSFDSALLRLGRNCTYPTFPLALEMITGCGRDDCPAFDVLPAESVWEYSFDKAGQKSSVVVLLPKNVGDKVGIGEENISLPKEAILESHDEVDQRDSLVKITKMRTRNPILKLELGDISARVTYYSEKNYYILEFGSVISSAVVPPTKLGESDKRILIREKKLIQRPMDSRLLKAYKPITYSSLNEVLSNIFGIQCSAPYPNALALPVKGMYRLPNLALVEDSTTTRTRQTKQSPTADSANENNSSLSSNYSLSLEGELLLIKSGKASAKVKKANGHYFLLKGSTLNIGLSTLATHDTLKQKQKLMNEGHLTAISGALWELVSVNPVFDDLHSIVEMVVGFPCDPNEVLTKESELFGRKEGEFKEEKPALNVESSEFIDSIKTPEFLSIYSWDLVGMSATKHVDKSVINYNGSGIPLEICPFFKAESLNPGDKILLTLQYGGKNFAGHIIKEQIIPGVKSPRTRIFWDKDLGDLIREYFEESCGDCIIKFYKTENNKNSYVLDLFIIDSSLLLEEINQRDSLVKITRKYTRNSILKIELGVISGRVTYNSTGNYYILHFGSVISSVVVPPTKLGESDKRILIREKKLIPRSRDSRLLIVDQSIRYSSLTEILSNIFGIQCSAPYQNPLALPVNGMYRLPNLSLVEDSTVTKQIKNTKPIFKVKSEKINLDTRFENPSVTTNSGQREGKQSPAADYNNNNNNNNSSLSSNYSISLEGEVLLIKSEEASAKVKKANGQYFLLEGSTFNIGLCTIATQDALKQKQKLMNEGHLTAISGALWKLGSVNPVFDNIHTIVEMVVGFPCDPNEVLNKESELFRRKEEELREETPEPKGALDHAIALKLETLEDAQLLAGELRLDLKILGIANGPAKIIAALMIYGDMPISQLAKATNTLNKERLAQHSKDAQDTGYITTYQKLNSKNRMITYFMLTPTPIDIYNKLRVENNDLITNLSNMLQEINYHVRNTRDIKKIIIKLNALGIDENLAKVLTYLYLSPKTPFPNMFDQTNLDDNQKGEALRALYKANWLRSEGMGQISYHSLKMGLDEIALDYVLKHAEMIECSLRQFKEICHIIEEDPNRNYLRAENCIKLPDNQNNKWVQVSETRLQRLVDNTFRTYHVTTIPEKYLPFFNVNGQTLGEQKEITVFFNGKSYSGIISRIDPHNPRTRLAFRNELIIAMLNESLSHIQDPVYLIFDQDEKYSDAYIISFQRNGTELLKKRRIRLEKKDYVELLTQSLDKIIDNYNLVSSNPLNLTLKHPFPERVRIYLYKITPTTKKQGLNAYRIGLSLPGKPNQSGCFDFSNTDLVMVGGYEPELKVFVFWNAYIHKEFSYYQPLIVKSSLLYSAMVDGFAEITKNTKKKKREHIIAVTPEYLSKGIEWQYDQHLTDLLGK